MIRSGRLDVEIRRHRTALKKWVVGRIAASPDHSMLEEEATFWFHGLPVDERSQLVTDVARLNVKDVDLVSIVTGPLGTLFCRFPQIFEGKAKDDADDVLDRGTEEGSAILGDVMDELEFSHPGWSGEWSNYERSLENPIWPSSAN